MGFNDSKGPVVTDDMAETVAYSDETSEKDSKYGTVNDMQDMHRLGKMQELRVGVNSDKLSQGC
jgi:hypothetical protein